MAAVVRPRCRVHSSAPPWAPHKCHPRHRQSPDQCLGQTIADLNLSFLPACQPLPREDGFTCCDYSYKEVDIIIRYENYANQLLMLLGLSGVTPTQIAERIGAVRAISNCRDFCLSHTCGWLRASMLVTLRDSTTPLPDVC